MPQNPNRRNVWLWTLILLGVSFFVSIYTPVTFLFLFIPIALTPFVFGRKKRDNDHR